MQLGTSALNPGERRRRLDANLCLYCGGKEHFAAACPGNRADSPVEWELRMSQTFPISRTAPAPVPCFSALARGPSQTGSAGQLWSQCQHCQLGDSTPTGAGSRTPNIEISIPPHFPEADQPSWDVPGYRLRDLQPGGQVPSDYHDLSWCSARWGLLRCHRTSPTTVPLTFFRERLHPHLLVGAWAWGHGGIYTEVSGGGNHPAIIVTCRRWLLLCGEKGLGPAAVHRLPGPERHHRKELVSPPAGVVRLELLQGATVTVLPP